MLNSNHLDFCEKEHTSPGYPLARCSKAAPKHKNKNLIGEKEITFSSRVFYCWCLPFASGPSLRVLTSCGLPFFSPLTLMGDHPFPPGFDRFSCCFPLEFRAEPVFRGISPVALQAPRSPRRRGSRRRGPPWRRRRRPTRRPRCRSGRRTRFHPHPTGGVLGGVGNVELRRGGCFCHGYCGDIFYIFAYCGFSG